jgi:hypothetical protein
MNLPRYAGRQTVIDAAAGRKSGPEKPFQRRRNPEFLQGFPLPKPRVALDGRRRRAHVGRHHCRPGGGAMTDYHEPWDALPEQARNLHRALTSLKEEIEAVDWYHQRVVLCTDPSLREVLAHNRDEEIEHACMTLEWLRRNMPGWEEQLRACLFTDGPIDHAGEAFTGPEPAASEQAPAQRTTALGIGSLKGR